MPIDDKLNGLTDQLKLLAESEIAGNQLYKLFEYQNTVLSTMLYGFMKDSHDNYDDMYETMHDAQEFLIERLIKAEEEKDLHAEANYTAVTLNIFLPMKKMVWKEYMELKLKEKEEQENETK